jgi:hypothetical protein
LDNKTPVGFVHSDTLLWIAFVHAIVDAPAILNDIPKGTTVVLSDPEFAEQNLRKALRAARCGSDVYIRHFP